MEAFRTLPLIYRLSIPLRIAILPAGIALLVWGSKAAGLILCLVWVVDTAVVSPLILAHFRRRDAAGQ
jgi:hypothetical protein